MKEAYISAISYYLPEQVLTNDDLVEEFPEWTVDKIAGKVGVSERHVAAEDETAGDMAVKAAERLFEEHGIDRNDIDFLILCTQSPDYFLPSTSCVVQDRLGLGTHCGAFGIDLGCSGYVYGLGIAKGLIAGGLASNILLITSETYTKHLHHLDKGNRTIFGDGAAATLVSTSGYGRVGVFSLGTDGRGAEGLIHKTGAWRHIGCMNDITFDENGNPHSSDFLYMDGKAIFDFTADAVPPMVEEAMLKNSLSLDDIDLVVFHQCNKYMINYLRKMIGIEKGRFYVCLDKVGNTVSSTIPIALAEALKEGRLHGKVLLAGFGVGFSFGATVIYIE